MPVNRVGDFGLAPGISGRFTLFQTVDFSTIFARASAPRNSWISCNMRLNAITLICILLLIGAVGKSAQIGSHTWSPDAMEGDKVEPSQEVYLLACKNRERCPERSNNWERRLTRDPRLKDGSSEISNRRESRSRSRSTIRAENKSKDTCPK
ncbi:hypothetical protein JHK86_013970 [Glycine max]|nr:hypothetical protein JHK86_013970 [Glycine max]